MEVPQGTLQECAYIPMVLGVAQDSLALEPVGPRSWLWLKTDRHFLLRLRFGNGEYSFPILLCCEVASKIASALARRKFVSGSVWIG